ncbi:pseudouridine synthase [Pseudorhodoplanes sinuspersici]|nr:pseudouridine synthase [Pseudorhodoplanes sinuspersici]
MTKEQQTAREGDRIAKVMARAGLCSRREAEAWIAAGRVTVNGAPITSPALNVTAKDKIAVDGKPMPQRERTRLFLYNKPRGLVTTHADPEKRPTIFEKLPKGLPRLVSVGRLDLNTEGLLLLTNDGGLARALELPQTGWLRRYRVRAHGAILQPQLDALRKGVTVNGIRYGAIEATVDRLQGANVWLTFAIREGKNREVRNVLEHLGMKVNRLIRVSFGPFQLGDLKEGAVEEIRTRHLREQLGERIATLAEADFSGPISEIESDDADDAKPAPRKPSDVRNKTKSGKTASPTRTASPSRILHERGRDEERTKPHSHRPARGGPPKRAASAKPHRRDHDNADPRRGDKRTGGRNTQHSPRGKRKR